MMGPPGAMGPPGFPQPGGAEVGTTLPLILNIVGILLCCSTYGLGFVLSTIGLIFTIMAMTSKAQDPNGARGKAKIGLIMGIISVALGVIVWIIWLALIGVSNMMPPT